MKSGLDIRPQPLAFQTQWVVIRVLRKRRTYHSRVTYLSKFLIEFSCLTFFFVVAGEAYFIHFVSACACIICNLKT